MKTAFSLENNNKIFNVVVQYSSVDDDYHFLDKKVKHISLNYTDLRKLIASNLVTEDSCI